MEIIFAGNLVLLWLVLLSVGKCPDAQTFVGNMRFVRIIVMEMHIALSVSLELS
jgi:hypothetical protein